MCVYLCMCVCVLISLTEHTDRGLARIGLTNQDMTKQAYRGRKAYTQAGPTCVCNCVCVCVCACVCVSLACRALRRCPDLDNVLISIDTFYAEVARHAVEAGADIVNDVSGGTLDTDMTRQVRGCIDGRSTRVLVHKAVEPA